MRSEQPYDWQEQDTIIAENAPDINALNCIGRSFVAISNHLRGPTGTWRVRLRLEDTGIRAIAIPILLRKLYCSATLSLHNVSASHLASVFRNRTMISREARPNKEF